ncbi:MAG TPA: hypothetical protein VNA89_11495 [Gemmatimonadaceae bacterium]|nr:hypothetical protein [Gemmatimonadaceae bacterium]
MSRSPGILRRLVATAAALTAFLPAFAAVGESRFDRTPRGIHVEALGTVDAAAHPVDCELCRALTLNPVAAPGAAFAAVPLGAAAHPGSPPEWLATAASAGPSARAPPRS